jgi:hypothetical protein
MLKGYSKYVGILVILLLLVSTDAAAATRFTVSGLGMADAKSGFAEFGILQYAVPSLSSFFIHSASSPVTLTLDNSAGTDGYFQVVAAVYHNSALLTSVTFGRHNAIGGELVLSGEKRVYRFDATGIKTVSVVQTLLDQTGGALAYLGDALGLDVVAGEYHAQVLSLDQLEEAVVYRNTLPNGQYQIMITLKQYDGSGGWVDVATHTETFSILDTIVEQINPVGKQGRFIPEYLEFSVSGFPAQISCLNTQVELREGLSVLWRSDIVSVGASSACQYRAVQDKVYVALPLPHYVMLIGGIEYTWIVQVMDALNGRLVATRTTHFYIPNSYPEVAIEPMHSGDLLQVRPQDNVQFVAQVFDYEDDQLGYDTNLTWWVKPPGSRAQSTQVGNKEVLLYAFAQPGLYELELQATDRFGAMSTATRQVMVEENRLPQLTIKAIQVRHASQTRNVAWSQKGQVVELAKQTYQVNDRLMFTIDVADADGDDVRLVLRNNQTPLYTTSVQGVGTVVVEVELSQPANYSLAIDVVDSKAGAQSRPLGSILVLPSAVPVVSIVSPTPGSRYTAGTVINLRADAYDVDDLVPVVDWYRLNVQGSEEKLGTGHNLVYRVLDGVQSIQARVKAQRPQENKTITGVSTPITLYGHTVPNEKPQVSIVSPTGGLIRTTQQTSGSHTVTLQAEASDTDGPEPLTYTWYIADELVARSTNRISYTFDGIGVWPIRVVVSDGKDTSTAEVAMVVTEASTFAFQIKDADGNKPQQRYRQGDVLNLQAEYDSPEEVTLVWQLSDSMSGASNSTELVALGNPAQIALDKVGDFILEVVAVDTQGRRGSAQLSLSVRENQVPEVDFVIWPESVFVGDVFNITVDPKNVDDAAQVSVTDPEGDEIVAARWYLNGVNVGTDLRFPATFAYPGTYIYYLSVTDSRGGIGEGGFVIDVIRDLRPPQVTIMQPGVQTIPLNTPITLSAVISDPEGEDRIVNQIWYVDGQALEPGQVVFTPDQVKEYVIACLAQDRAGNIGGATTKVTVVPTGVAQVAPEEVAAPTRLDEPQLVAVHAPWQVYPHEPFELQAEVKGDPNQRYTVTWLLQGSPVATGFAWGGGVVRNELALPNAGIFTLTARIEGATTDTRSVNIQVVMPKEPMIVSPNVPPNSVQIMSNPITFKAVNIPEGAELMWASDVDGVLKENIAEVTTTLSAGLHTVTLWIDDVGISVQVLVQQRVEPLQQVGIITAWSGAPEIVRYDGRVTRLRQGADFSDYSAADLVLYDVDRLQLGADDALQLRLIRNGQELRYTSQDDGKSIDSWGIPYEPGEQSE